MARLLKDRQSDFSRGMYDSVAAIRYPQNAARAIVNGRLQPDGNVKRRDGTRRKHPTALAEGTGFGGFMFETAGGTLQEIAIVGSNAYMSDDRWATSSEIQTGLREDYYDFATMRVGASNYLLMANGDSTVKRWDGSSWDTLSGAPSGVKFIEVFNSRLWVSGHNGVLVQGSKVADPDIFASPSGVTLQNLVHSGDVPTGLFQLGPHLLVFTEQSISYIDGFGEQSLIVATDATGFSRSVGCVAFRTIRAIGDDGVGFLSLRGIEYFSQSTGIVLASRFIQEFMDSVDFDAINTNRGRPTACYDPVRQDYLCAVPTGGARNSRTIVVNMYHRGSGWFGAPSIDSKLASVPGGELKFGADADGYITLDPNGFGLTAGPSGYVTYATDGDGSDPVIETTDGYIGSATDDALPASLYIGPCIDGARVVHSVGYDGFVRKHFGDDFEKDDEASTPSSSGGDLGQWSMMHLGVGGVPLNQELTIEEQAMMIGTYGEDEEEVVEFTRGGQDVQLTLVPRPFVFRRPGQGKRVRAVYVGTINDGEVTVSVAVRAAGQVGAAVSRTIPSSDFGQSRRARFMMHAIGDAPQIQITTTDRTRIALVEVAAELLREPV